ncbi:PREDICTED: uncharacterized protein LOC106337269 [Brassica oleracea var. oleracea]|uniref:uncharacterized protein LOC106337269 n=1 Tax=Brassica oleracea var. oleracea TaxID=109376 RepID=UPI0006A6C0C7|nr:PREDICTED: uncharacterized protein LOC106337269 [Brassica oleracea var. oleracea]
MIIRHHLVESLKNQYLTIEDPLDLGNELKSRYDHQRTVILPKARSDWRDLRIQDYKSVDEYNSAMFKIVSKLKLCGESITDEDTLRKNNELLMRNSEMRPVGSAAPPEAHTTEDNKESHYVQGNDYHGRGRGSRNRQGCGRKSLKGKNHEAHMVYQDNEKDFDHDKEDLMDYETSDCLKD